MYAPTHKRTVSLFYLSCCDKCHWSLQVSQLNLIPSDFTPTTMNSLELVEFINSQRADGEAELRHDSFMAKVPKVLGEAAPKFIGTAFYTNGTGARVSRAIYTFPKREACLMAMSYSYDLQAKVFDRMTALEAKAAAPALPDFSNPATAARAWADAVELAQAKAIEVAQQRARLSIVGPKADALDLISTCSVGAMCITNAAKSLQMQPKQLFAWLQSKKWIYRRVGGSGWVGYQGRIQSGLVEHKITPVEHSDGSTRYSEQVLITAKGLAKMAIDVKSQAV